jgi:hypothetical protein
MAQKKKTSNVTNVLAIACIVSLIFLSASLIFYSQQTSNVVNKNNQIASLQNKLTATKPNLISISLQYTDNRSNTNTPFLQISGYVVNVGNGQANNCTIHITAYRDGNVTALDTSATIPSLDAGADETINVQFPYTGQPLGFYNSYLTWTN